MNILSKVIIKKTREIGHVIAFKYTISGTKYIVKTNSIKVRGGLIKPGRKIEVSRNQFKLVKEGDAIA
jgi:hypothetical protein